MRRPSPMLSPIGVRGSRLAYGSWKMICIRRRYGLRAAPLSLVMSMPSNMDRARRRLDQAQEQPARPSSCRSPTRRPARASRRGGSRSSTPSTAWTVPTVALEDPAADGEVLDEVADLDERRAGRRLGAGARRGAGGRRDVGRHGVARHGRASRSPARPGRAGRSPWRVVVQPAADLVVRGRSAGSSGWTSVGERDVLLDLARRAARREPAALGQVDEVGHVARDDRQLVLDVRPTTGIEPIRPCV